MTLFLRWSIFQARAVKSLWCTRIISSNLVSLVRRESKSQPLREHPSPYLATLEGGTSKNDRTAWKSSGKELTHCLKKNIRDVYSRVLASFFLADHPVAPTCRPGVWLGVTSVITVVSFGNSWLSIWRQWGSKLFSAWRFYMIHGSRLPRSISPLMPLCRLVLLLWEAMRDIYWA